MKRKKREILLAVALLLFGILILQTNCSKKDGKITELIAKDAQLVVIVPNIAKAAGKLSSMLETLTIKIPILGMLRQQMTIATGFDITNTEELGKKGFDFQGGLAVVMLKVRDGQGYGIVQIKDKDAFLAFLNDANAKQGNPAFAKEGDFYSSSGTYLTFKGKFAIIGDNQKILKNVGEGDSINGSDDFNSIIKKIGEGDIIFYTSPGYLKSFAKKASELPDTKAIEAITNIYGAMGFSINFDKTFIEGKSFIKMMDMSRMKKVFGGTGGSDMLTYLPEGAWAIAKAKTDFPEMWQWIKEMLFSSDPRAKTEIENAFKEAENQLGFDVEEDVIANIEGNPIIVIYGLSLKTTPELDMVLTVTLKDEEKIKGILGNLAKMAPPVPTNLSQLGVVVFPIESSTSLYLTTRNKHLIVAFSSGRILEIINMIEGKGKIKNVIETANPAVKTYLENKNSDIAYIGIGTLLNIIKTELSKEETKKMSMFTGGGTLNDAYLVALDNVEDDGIGYSVKLFWGE